MHPSQRNGSRKRSDSSRKTSSRASQGARFVDGSIPLELLASVQLFTFAPSPSRSVLWAKTSALTTGVLNGFPLFECDFDRQKIFMFAVVGMFLDGGASPSKSSTACRANGIFRKDLGQRIRELVIKCRNVGAASHVFFALPRVRTRHYIGFAGLKPNGARERVTDLPLHLFIGAREKSRPLCKAAYTNRSCPELLAYVGNELLRICLGRGRWLRRQLKHRCFLTHH